MLTLATLLAVRLFIQLTRTFQLSFSNPCANEPASFVMNGIICFLSQMRDNLIRREACFDHREILRDLFGEIGNDDLPITRDQLMSSPGPGPFGIQEEDDDPVTAGRHGLIVWGEPYEDGNWEATPGFLRKWAWVVEDCPELVRVSSRWRMTRGAEPLQLHTAITCPLEPPAFSIVTETSFHLVKM